MLIIILYPIGEPLVSPVPLGFHLSAVVGEGTHRVRRLPHRAPRRGHLVHLVQLVVVDHIYKSNMFSPHCQGGCFGQR